MSKIKLFCLPHAGGSAAIYYKWKKYIDSNIEVTPLELAGRGRRISESFYESILSAVDGMYNTIKPIIRDCDYAFYGHSMGTIIAFELCRKIMDTNERQPLHLFVSGRYPPSIKRAERYLSRLPDNMFLEEICKLGGTSDELIKNKELCDIFVPILKADYRIIEEYKYIDCDKKFNYGITVFNGKADPEVFYNEVKEWEKHTLLQCPIYEFEGDHFFINDKIPEIAEIINSTIDCIISKSTY
ncbi:thioesterase [Ruminiclostridium herbifermentans]|uniref:Thioesterase n=1 Tax=Ruminiclostridium herbifermentans TaxID=2488810 RepID=A0A4U7JHN3_9FIRM|nr:thioesterase domain-containing protein [Ruminiclostridium herbifermentans]QNU67643.1 thioesterase [Ruminiclostridium herbifermentans]